MATNLNLTEGHFFVSVDGNRLKQYTGNTIYLDNGREFQLEVFNPTTSKLLAKIKINGNYISTSGLVLKPGQRVFLERYFDIAKKFKYETYTVDNSPETAGAIANNGLIEIEFYKEYVPATTITYTYYPPIWDSKQCIVNGLTNPYTTWCDTNISSGISGGLNNDYSNIKTVNTSYTSSVNLNGSLSNGNDMLKKQSVDSDSTRNAFSFSDVSFSNGDEKYRSLEFAPKFDHKDLSRNLIDTKKETGRVEAGSSSDQSFVMDYATYNSFYSSKVSWKILPLSQKPIEVSDLKTFCPNCRTRIKKSSWKYCPNCSEEL